jgi:enoyl-CoA hydratase/carnithine racemase
MPQTIVIERNGRITTIRLNRPEVLNAVNPAMHRELQSAFDAFAADEGQRVCVVTGTGPRAFCVGSDLKAGAREQGFQYPKNGYAGLIERFDLNKPVIAAVNGLCLGGGFEIALACDLIIASRQASFGLTEPLVGAVALAGGIHRLVRHIGLKRAMGYLLTGARISPAEAWELGLLNEVVDHEGMESAVDRWCEALLTAAPLAVEATKETALRGLSERDLASALRHQHDYPAYKRWWNSEDTREGVRAFAEKRTPVWCGK